VIIIIIIILELINSITVLKYGPRRQIGPAVLRMPEPSMCSMYAKITFAIKYVFLSLQTSQLRGKTEQMGSTVKLRLRFLIVHSQI